MRCRTEEYPSRSRGRKHRVHRGASYSSSTKKKTNPDQEHSQRSYTGSDESKFRHRPGRGGAPREDLLANLRLNRQKCGHYDAHACTNVCTVPVCDPSVCLTAGMRLEEICTPSHASKASVPTPGVRLCVCVCETMGHDRQHVVKVGGFNGSVLSSSHWLLWSVVNRAAPLCLWGQQVVHFIAVC